MLIYNLPVFYYTHYTQVITNSLIHNHNNDTKCVFENFFSWLNFFFKGVILITNNVFDNYIKKKNLKK